MITTQTNNIALVDAEFDEHKLQVFKINTVGGFDAFVIIRTQVESENTTIFTLCDTEEEMIDNIQWFSWRLQGVKDKELAKKLEGRV